LFEAPTVGGLSERVEEHLRQGKKAELPEIVPVSREMPLPLSFAQQRLWFLHQLEPGSSAYNVRLAVRLNGVLDTDALTRTFDEIIRRHEVLRTSFPTEKGEPLQQIAGSFRVVVPVEDLSEETNPEQKAEEIAADESRQPFDLSRGPLLRLRLLGLNADEHILLATVHHIVSDGWSMEVLKREFTVLYEAFSHQRQSPLPELKIQYADFAHWQRQWLSGDVLESQLQYWREQLEGVFPLELPMDHARPPIPSRQGKAVKFSVNERITSQLRRLGHQEGVTLFMILLAAFQLLLGRYSGQDDVTIGSPIAGRNRLEIEGLIGFFVNQLALRTKLTGNPTFRELLGRVRQTVLGAYDHQDLPFEKLVEELAPERTPGRAPLFQVAFAMLHESDAVLQLPGVHMRGIESEERDIKWDMMFWLREQRSPANGHLSLAGTLAYATDLFEHDTIEQMATHYERLLAEVAENPEQHLQQIPLLNHEDWQQVVEQWNETGREHCTAKCIQALFEEQAGLRPNAIAVVCEDLQMTYADLNKKACQLGRYLRTWGVGPEVRVGLCVERNAEMIVGILGILKAGGGYVPLDPRFPTDRMAYMLENAQAALILTQERLRMALPSTWAQVICLDSQWEEIARHESTEIGCDAGPDNLAYVIYTSGSTGEPKGVAIAHRQIVHYTQSIISRLEPVAGSSFALMSTFAADLGNTMLFPSLCGGGILHLIPEFLAVDQRAMASYFLRCGIDCLKITPTHLSALMTSADRALMPERHLVIGGEAFGWEWTQRLMSAKTGCQIWNHYGPTECTVGVLMNPITEGQAATHPAVPLGRPLDNIRAYVLDGEGMPTPIGVPGELYIGGVGLARGYLNDPDVTAARFVPDPFGREPGARLYGTGDLVRWRRNGNLEYLGRKDEQVKIRGYRVELGEIETLLKRHPGVERCAVVARERDQGDKQLVAYVVPSGRTVGPGRYLLPNGVEIAHQNKHETDYLYEEIFEKEVYLQYGIVLPEDACVFDVGANIGIFALFAAERCPKGRIYSFEPVAETFERLLSNSREAENIKVFPVGISDVEREATFMHYPQYSMMSGLAEYANPEKESEVIRTMIGNRAAGGDADASTLLEHDSAIIARYLKPATVRCQMRRLSELIRQESVDRIDLMKINVPRSELDVLRGIDDKDWEAVQQVVLEVHDKQDWGTQGRVVEISNLLEQRGFSVCAMQYDALRGTDRWGVYARKSSFAGRSFVRPAAVRAEPAVAKQVSAADLRTLVSEKLPDYMVPSAFVMMSSLPLTANGKLDRRALPEPERVVGKGDEGEELETGAERILGGIWAQVLRVDRVGGQDNFFELGGDSILSIKVVARAMQAGLEITVQQMFQHQRLRELAAVARTGNRREGAEEEVRGEVALTAIQRWFFEQEAEAGHHFNQALLLKARGPLDAGRLGAAVEAVMKHHEGVRLRYWREVGGGWRQRYAEKHEPVFTQIDLGGVEGEKQAELMEEICAALQRSLDLERGPLARVAYFEWGEGRGGRLLWVMHHLIVDGVSWRILLEDLHTAWQQLEAGGGVMLPGRTMSLQKWAEGLKEWTASGALEEEAGFWLGLKERKVGRLPRDYEGGSNSIKGSETVVRELGEKETMALLRQAPRRYQTQMQDVLLTALAATVAEWTGEEGVLVEMEGHGREAVQGDANVTRTVGWFTTHFPVWLPVRQGMDLERGMEAVRRAMAAVPRHGIGYGLLRYVASNEQMREELSALPQAEISFNYLGQLDEALPAESLFGPASEGRGPSQDERQKRSHPLTVLASISDGKLNVGWDFNRELHRWETVEGLAARFMSTLQEIANLCHTAPPKLSPADFPMAKLNSEQLQSIARKVGKQVASQKT